MLKHGTEKLQLGTQSLNVKIRYKNQLLKTFPKKPT